MNCVTENSVSMERLGVLGQQAIGKADRCAVVTKPAALQLSSRRRLSRRASMLFTARYNECRSKEY